MYCVNCGTELPNTAVKCHKCSAETHIKPFSWLAFILGFYFYAGYNPKKAYIAFSIYFVITTLLSTYIFTSDLLSMLSNILYFIISGIYLGIVVAKDNSFIQKKKFKWIPANLLAITMFAISFYSALHSLDHSQNYNQLMQLL